MEVKYLRSLERVYRSDKRYVLAYGGAGSGKSRATAQRIILEALQGTTCLVMRKWQTHLKDSVYAELKQAASDLGVGGEFSFGLSPLDITCTRNGAKVLCRGLDDPEKIKSISGISKVWLEEATDFTEADFNQLVARVRGVGNGQFFLSFNPVNPGWLKPRFFDQKSDDIEIIFASPKDNVFLEHEYLAYLQSMKDRDPNFYKVYWLGEWGGAVEGRIFSEYEVIDEPPSDLQWQYGVDFGFSFDPTAVVKWALQGNALYTDLRLYKTNWTNADLITWALLNEDHKARWVCDSSEPARIEDMRRAGINAHPARKGPDSIKAGIDLLKQYDIKVIQSPELVHELDNYSWQQTRQGEWLERPVDNHNHAIDALRYGVFTGHKLRGKQKSSTFKNSIKRPQRAARR